jgi:hypothetical protein
LPIKSARHFFNSFAKKTDQDFHSKIVLAEAIVGEHEKHDFYDLLELETLVADLVSVVLLFAESPGSLAELGAFAADDAIRQRLVAVIEDRFRDRTESFIHLGPIRRITRRKEDAILYAAWLSEVDPATSSPEVDVQLSEIMAETVVANTVQSMKKAPESATFPRQEEHTEARAAKMALITGLLDVFQILTKSDVDRALTQFAFPATQQAVNRYFYVLYRVGIIGSFEYSGQTWYYANNTLVMWSYKKDSRIRDTPEWRRHLRDRLTEKRPAGNYCLPKYARALRQLTKIRIQDWD